MRFTLSTLFLGLAATLAVAKPLSMDPVRVLVDCSFAGHVTIVAVERGDWMGEKARGKIRVRVAGDPALVLRGLHRVGTEFELLPFSGGPMSCSDTLDKLRKSGESVFLAASGDQVAFVARRIEAEKGWYRLETWCDYNAWWMYSTESFGRRVEKSPMTTIEAPWSELAGRLNETRTATLRELGRRFARPDARPIVAASIPALLADLGGVDHAKRTAAETRLEAEGREHLAALRAALDETKSLEQRARLGRLVARLASPGEALEAWWRARKEPELEARLLLEVISAAGSRPAFTDRLRALTGRVSPPLRFTGEPSAAKLVELWRERYR